MTGALHQAVLADAEKLYQIDDSIPAGWYAQGGAATPVEVRIRVFSERATVIEGNVEVEGDLITARGVARDYQPSAIHSNTVEYGDILVYTDVVTGEANPWRIMSISAVDGGEIEFLLAEAADVVL